MGFMSLTDDTPIDYRFLNMDAKRFEPSELELNKAMGAVRGGTFMVIPNKDGQVLIAAGHGRERTFAAAIAMCRRLSDA